MPPELRIAVPPELRIAVPPELRIAVFLGLPLLSRLGSRIEISA